jgi:hypothetical protein
MLVPVTRAKCAPSPAANAFNHAPSAAADKASASKKPSGLAPLAARSDKFIHSALRPIVSGGSSAKKCTPAIAPSVVSTTSQPGGGVERSRIVDETERTRFGGKWAEKTRDQNFCERFQGVCLRVANLLFVRFPIQLLGRTTVPCRSMLSARLPSCASTCHGTPGLPFLPK